MMSGSFKREKSSCEGSRLTGGGGLSGIDVADDDHVDVHLLLTAMRRMVSRCSIKMSAIAMSMLPMESQMLDGIRRWRGRTLLTHPMIAVVDVCFLVCVGWTRG